MTQEMERWIGKVAIVTGASSGIGAQIAQTLAEAGLTVIGLARRVDRLNSLEKKLSNAKGTFHGIECDISSLDSIKKAFGLIKVTFGRLHVFVSNAAVLKYTKLLSEDNEKDLKEIFDVNLFGFIFCAKEAYKLMKETNEESHIIVLGSILASSIPVTEFGKHYNLLPSSKFAVRAATEVLRQELLNEKNFRITTINPGFVKTDMIASGNHPNPEKFLDTDAILEPKDIAEAVLFVLRMPKNVVVSEITVKPLGES